MGTIYPKLKVAFVGSTVNFTCYSTVEPNWSKNNNGLMRYASIFTDRLNKRSHYIILYNVIVKDSGSYYCHGRTYFGRNFVTKAELYVGRKLQVL